MILLERAQEVVNYAKEYGDDVTVRQFGINHETLGRYRREVKRKVNFPKILVFDIENAPTEAYVWNKRMYNTSISPDQLKEDTFMICWAGKWLYNPEVMTNCLTPEEAVNKDDTRIVKGLWNLFDQADLIIAHNAFKFDIPMANSRFLEHGLNPPSPYRVIDTLRIAKAVFSETFNSLNFLGKKLHLGEKEHTEFQLWVDCLHGKKDALDRMLSYNIQDTRLLEEVYHVLKGWAVSHPNLNVYQETEDCCTHCGSPNIRRKGEYATQRYIYPTYQCQECGGYSWKSTILKPTAR